MPLDEIDAVLAYCEINTANHRKDSFNHWRVAAEQLRKLSGRRFSDVRQLLRHRVGVDFRYLDTYLDSYRLEGIIRVENDYMYWLGLPDGAEIPEPEPEEPRKKPQPPTQDDKFVEETHDRVDPALTIVEKEIMAKQALAEYEKKQKVKKNAPADT